MTKKHSHGKTDATIHREPTNRPAPKDAVAEKTEDKDAMGQENLDNNPDLLTKEELEDQSSDPSKVATHEEARHEERHEEDEKPKEEEASGRPIEQSPEREDPNVHHSQKNGPIFGDTSGVSPDTPESEGAPPSPGKEIETSRQVDTGWQRGPMPKDTHGWGGVVPVEQVGGFHFCDFRGDHVVLVPSGKKIMLYDVAWYNNCLTLPPTNEKIAGTPAHTRRD